MFLCVMTSLCMLIDSPSHEDSFNLYVKGIPLLKYNLWPIFHRYVNSTCILHLWAFQAVLVSLTAYLGFTQYTFQGALAF